MTDGGASWTRLPGPPAGAAHIRFASPEVGYAWSAAGSLWITTDGAASWQPGGLAQVLSLETAAGWVWSIAGAQPYPDIWRAPAGSTAWTNLGLTPDRSATLTIAYVHLSDIPPGRVCLAWDAVRRSRLIHVFAAIAADRMPVAGRS